MENEDKPEEPKAPEWQYKNDFAINSRMKEILQLTIQATEAELAQLRRKLNKLTYGG